MAPSSDLEGQPGRGHAELLPLGLCAVAAIIWFSAPDPAMSLAAQAARPWLWNVVVGLALAVGVVAVCVQRLLARRRYVAPVTEAVPRRLGRAAALAALPVAAALGVDHLGFPLSLAGAIAVGAAVLGLRPWWKAALFSLAGVGSLWLLLTQALQFYLPLWPGW